LAFGPDGNLYVASMNTNQILRYDGHTGAFLGVFAAGAGVDGPTYLLFQATDTTTTIKASADNTVFGQPVTFTVSVTASTPNVNAPGGKVVFTVDGVPQPAVPVVNGQASLTTASLGVGTHQVSAAYQGDDHFNASASDSVTVTVAKAQTSTVLTSSQNPAVAWESVTFTVTVSAVAPGAGTPTGTVTFRMDGIAVKKVKLVNGVAKLTLALPPGRYVVTAKYNGDDHFVASKSAKLVQKVKPHPPHHHHGDHDCDD
jgi:hypothetical protein